MCKLLDLPNKLVNNSNTEQYLSFVSYTTEYNKIHNTYVFLEQKQPQICSVMCAHKISNIKHHIHPPRHCIVSTLKNLFTQDLLGIQLLNLVHPDDASRVTEALRRAMISQGAQASKQPNTFLCFLAHPSLLASVLFAWLTLKRRAKGTGYIHAITSYPAWLSLVPLFQLIQNEC